MSKVKGVVIDYETADRITLHSLQDHRDTLKKELKAHRKDPEKNWMHADDVARTPELIEHFTAIIKYYGGD